MAAGHPKSLRGILPAPLLKALDAHVELSEAELCSKRISWAKKWTHDIVKGEEEEAFLKNKLPKMVSRFSRIKG